jgi:type I restriction enzyme S subunit
VIAGLKPYVEMKDSDVPWLGKVPAHWDVRRGKWLFRHRKKINADRNNTNVLSLTLRGVVNNDPDNPEGLVPKDYATYQLFERNNLVFKLIDLENLRTSRVGLVHEDGIMSSAYVRLILRSVGDIRYFFRQYYDLYQRGIYNQLGAGVRSTLGSNDLLDLSVLAPPISEQAAIVRFLDHADRRIRRAIAAKQKLIKLLEEQKQAIIHRAVTRGLDPDVRLKPSGVEWLGDVPEHWEGVRLKYVAQVQTGITLGKTYPKVELVERPYLRVANVQAGHLKLTNVTHVQVPHSEADRSTLRIGDVLMTEGGDIDKLGRGCVWRGEVVNCLHQNHVFAVRPSMTKLLPEFLEALMGSQHGRRYFQLTAKQTTNLAATNGTTVGNFPLLLPRTDEQQCILNWLEERTMPLAEVSARASREISLLREYRTHLIADVVTGKLDVREAAARLSDEAHPAGTDLDEGLIEDGAGIDGQGGEVDSEDVAA